MGNRVTTTYDADGEKLTVTDALEPDHDVRLLGARLGGDGDRPDGLRRHLHLHADRQEPGDVPDPAGAVSRRSALHYDADDRLIATAQRRWAIPRPTPTTVWAM